VTTTPQRLRLRRRLMIYSAPLTAVMVLTIVKLISVVVAGNSAVTAFTSGNGQAVAIDATVLGVANVVEPANAPFAAGVAAALSGRLDEAEAQFVVALSFDDVGQSCPARVNLELVRETRGDRAAAAHDRALADRHYVSAQAVVTAAPRICFADNNDPDPRRLAIRRDTAPRLHAKRNALNALNATVLPPAPPPATPPPPPQLPPTPTPGGQEVAPRRLDPGGGDPVDKLRQVLQDAAGAAAPTGLSPKAIVETPR
jgi:hypothetical protein